MTVKEIFELRKQGKIEEAYDAIRPLYAAHKGRYTSLCMFWTASDIFKKRLRDGHIEEAAKIFEALKRVLPYIKDNDPHPDGVSDFHDDGIPKLGIDKETNSSSDSAAGFMQTAARRLTQARQLEQLEQSRQEKLSAREASLRASRDLAIFRNPQEAVSSQEEISAISALSAGQEVVPALEELSNTVNSCPQKEDSGLEENDSAFSAGHKDESQETETLSVNKEEQTSAEDVSGHLSVSLDEGIIRPIKGLTAIQRVILACVVGHHGYSLAKISEGTGIPQPIVEQNINVLADRGLIEYRDTKQSSGYYPL